MLVITNKLNRVVAVHADKYSGDSQNLDSLYPNNPEMKLQYIEHRMDNDKDVLQNPFKYEVVNNACVLRQPTIEEKLAVIREKRDYLLKQSDFTQLPDIPLTDDKKLEWKAYRKQLRDFPDLCDLNNPVWPIRPL